MNHSKLKLKSQQFVVKPVVKPLFLIHFFKKEQTMKYCSSWYRGIMAGLALLAGFALHTPVALAGTTVPTLTAQPAADTNFLAGGTVTSGGLSANTIVENYAQLNYSIAGATQPAEYSNLNNFRVDKIVKFLVTEQGTAPTLAPPAPTASITGLVTTFKVTNLGNAFEDFQLTAGQIASGLGANSQVSLGATYTDTFDATNCTVFVETNGTANYQAGAGGDLNKSITGLSPVSTGAVKIGRAHV